MGIATYSYNRSTSGGEIIRELVNASDGQGLHFANGAALLLAYASGGVFGTADFSIEFILDQDSDNSSDNEIYTSQIAGSNVLKVTNSISSNVVRISFDSTNYDIAYDMSGDYGTPTHYVLTCDRSALATLYKNGNSVGTINISGSSAVNLGNGNTANGYLGGVSGYGVTGVFYRWRTWKKLLSAAEVTTCYENASVPITDQWSNCVTDLDFAFANPEMSLQIQSRSGAGDATASVGVSQVTPIEAVNTNKLNVGGTTPLVGIGLAAGVTPTEKLQVDGAALITGTRAAGVSSGLYLSYGESAGRADFVSSGVDATTRGGFKFTVREQDAGNAIDALTIDSAGDSTFSGAVTSTGAISHIDGGTIWQFKGSAGGDAANEKQWWLQGGSGTGLGDGSLALRAVNDAGSSGINAITITRTGISSIDAINLLGPVTATGLSTFSADIEVGAFSATGATTGLKSGVSGTDPEIQTSSTSTDSRSHYLFYNPNGAVGSIKTSGSATAFNTSSDYRLKENVTALTGALDRLDSIPVYNFNFKANPTKTVDGFLAHEVAEFVPEAISGEKDEMETVVVTKAIEAVEAVAATLYVEGDELPDGVAIGDEKTPAVEAVDAVAEVTEEQPKYQGIDQSKLVPLMLAAIKELKAKVTALENA